MVLGEKDVARVNPYRFWSGSTPRALGLISPSSNGGHWSPNAGGRLEVCLLPGGRRPPGPDYIRSRGMRGDVWRGQKEGSVV